MKFDASAKRDRAVTRAKCKRCGSSDVAWRKSERGKWYLVEVFTEGDENFSSRVWFHSLFCEKNAPEYDHAEIQAQFSADHETAEEERIRLRNQQEEEEATNNAMQFLAMVNAPEDERRAKLAKLEREQATFQRYPPTMDYMVEFSREVAAAKVRTRNIAILRASLGMIEEED